MLLFFLFVCFNDEVVMKLGPPRQNEPVWVVWHLIRMPPGRAASSECFLGTPSWEEAQGKTQEEPENAA